MVPWFPQYMGQNLMKLVIKYQYVSSFSVDEWREISAKFSYSIIFGDLYLACLNFFIQGGDVDKGGSGNERFTFSDGIGKMSLKLANMVSSGSSYTPWWFELKQVHVLLDSFCGDALVKWR